MHPCASPITTTDPLVLDLVQRWLDLSELDRRAFQALAHELTAVSDLVETSTQTLSDRFQTLTALTQAQVTRTNHIIDIAGNVSVDGQPVPISNALQSVETALGTAIDTIMFVSQHAMRMVAALEDIGRDVEGAEHCAGQVDRINHQARYLALNATIEASRSGAAGAAFNVIAHEMKDLSRATETTSQQVRARIAAVARGVRSGHAVLRDIASMDLSENIQAKQRINTMIAAIIDRNTQITSVLSDASRHNGELADTIDQMIIGMQFQDRTKQHLTQVSDTLAVLSDGAHDLQIATRQALPGQLLHDTIDEDRLRRVIDGQTLGAMKQRLLTRLLHTSPAAANQSPVGGTPQGQINAGDIDLF